MWVEISLHDNSKSFCLPFWPHACFPSYVAFINYCWRFSSCSRDVFLSFAVVLRYSHPKVSFFISAPTGRFDAFRAMCLTCSRFDIPAAAPFPSNVTTFPLNFAIYKRKLCKDSGTAWTSQWRRVTGSQREAGGSHAVPFQPHFAKSRGAQDNYLSGSCAEPRLHTFVSNAACDRPASSK